MGYPQQPPGGWPQQPQQPYPPQQGYPQPGYPPQPPPGYGQQPYPPQAPPGYPQPGYPAQPGPYAPQPGYPQQGPPGGNPWEQAYDEGDASGALYAEGWFPATVTENTFGTTSNGDKEAWKVKFRLDGGPNQGAPLSTTLALSLRKNTGEKNPGGLAALFRKLRAMGIPVGDKYGDPPGTVPFFRPQPQTGQPIPGEQVAQMTVGRQVEIEVVTDHEWQNSKIRGIRMQRTGGGQAPPPAGQPAPVPGAPPGYPPQQAPYPQQPPQPVGGPQAPGPYQQAPPAYQQAPPAYAGQPGMGQFTADGQAQQGPPQGPPPGPPQAPAPMQAAPGPMPPTQPSPAPAGPAGGTYPNGQPMAEQPQPGGAPPMPPWAQ